MSVKSVEILNQSISVEVSNIVVQTDSTVSTDAAAAALELASRAGASAYAYTGGKLTSISYSNFRGVTAHSKTLTYTGDNLTASAEAFTYDGNNWLYELAFAYTGGNLSSKTATLTIT